jgi:GAF domain-containing protein
MGSYLRTARAAGTKYDAENSSRQEMPPSPHGDQARSIASVPIVVGDRRVGGFSMENPRT